MQGKPLSKRKYGLELQKSSLALLSLSAEVRAGKVTPAAAAQIIRQTLTELTAQVPGDACPS